MESNSRPSLLSLPNEVLARIFSYCEDELWKFQMENVCTRFHESLYDYESWTTDTIVVDLTVSDRDDFEKKIRLAKRIQIKHLEMDGLRGGRYYRYPIGLQATMSFVSALYHLHNLESLAFLSTNDRAWKILVPKLSECRAITKVNLVFPPAEVWSELTDYLGKNGLTEFRVNVNGYHPNNIYDHTRMAEMCNKLTMPTLTKITLVHLDMFDFSQFFSSCQKIHLLTNVEHFEVNAVRCSRPLATWVPMLMQLPKLTYFKVDHIVDDSPNEIIQFASSFLSAYGDRANPIKCEFRYSLMKKPIVAEFTFDLDQLRFEPQWRHAQHGLDTDDHDGIIMYKITKNSAVILFTADLLFAFN